MDAIICEGCKQSVIPIRVMEKSKRGEQWWRITKCPRERCGYNLDLEKYERPGRNKEPEVGDSGRSFWNDDL